jgi:hypothetical protein
VKSKPKLPRWLSDECADAAQKVGRRQIDLDDAATDLADAAIDKDDDWIRDSIAFIIRGAIRGKMAIRGRAALKELERKTALAQGKTVQMAADDVCSYFFPTDTFSPSALLSEAAAYAYDLLARSERHWKVAVARVKYAEQLIKAVGGNKDGKATLGDAVKAFRESGGRAASE